MIDYRINDDKTIVGGGKGVILAGRCHCFRQQGEGGMGAKTKGKCDGEL